MKGVSNYLEFIRVRGKDSIDGRDLIISTDKPHIVGAIRTFAFNEVQENYRLQFLEGMKDPYFFAKAHGYRIYITLFGGLTPLPNSVIEEKEDIHNLLVRMVEYYAANCVSEGFLREYSDNAYTKLKKCK